MALWKPQMECAARHQTLAESQLSAGVELGDEVTLRGASARRNIDAKSAPISLPVVEKYRRGKVSCYGVGGVVHGGARSDLTWKEFLWLLAKRCKTAELRLNNGGGGHERGGKLMAYNCLKAEEGRR